LSETAASVTIFASREGVAREQVHLEEQQRVLGITPNFYVVHDSRNAVPLSTKLRFQLALRASTDPITIAGVGALAGMQEAGGTPTTQKVRKVTAALRTRFRTQNSTLIS